MPFTKLTRTQLYDLVWSTPIATIVKSYPIKANDLKQICQEMNIPMPPRDHWTKIRYGKADPQIPLSAEFDGNEAISFEEEPKTEKELLQEEILAAVGSAIKVPKKLIDPDPMILIAQTSLSSRKSTWNDGIITTRVGELPIAVSKVNIGRALRIMNTLIKCFEIRNYKFSKDGFTGSLEVREVSVSISLRETRRRIEPTDSYRSFDYEPTGRLCFKMDGYDGKEWVDGSTKLEDQLIKILIRIEWKALEMNRFWEENRIKKLEQALVEEEAKRIREQKEAEIKRFNDLIDQAKRWKEAQIIREYIQAMQQAGLSSEAWVEWAMSKANEHSPVA